MRAPVFFPPQDRHRLFSSAWFESQDTFWDSFYLPLFFPHVRYRQGVDPFFRIIEKEFTASLKSLENCPPNPDF